MLHVINSGNALELVTGLHSTPQQMATFHTIKMGLQQKIFFKVLCTNSSQHLQQRTSSAWVLHLELSDVYCPINACKGKYNYQW